MSAEIEARTLRKVGWRIIPFIMLLYFIAFVDRVNISFAALTMNKDIGLSQSAFGFGAGIFFLGYFLFEVPSNMILHRLGARLWIARVMISWGIVSAATAFVRGPESFYAVRFLLGLAEAGFFPGIILYLTFWFPTRNRAAVIAIFMVASPLSTAIGSPISGALLGLHGMYGLTGWQWMFLIEAAPAILAGIAVFFLLTDRPEQARWLQDDERKWLVGIMDSEAGQIADGDKHAIRRGLFDIRVLMLAVIYFGTSASLYAIGVWTPLILSQFHLTPLEIGFMNIIPGVVAIVGMILWSRHSDATGERSWHVAAACILCAAGLAWAGLAGSAVGVILAISLVNLGTNAAKAPLWCMASLFLSGSSAAVGIANINAIGNLGGFLGPAMIGWIKTLTGSYLGGLYFVAGLMLLSAGFSLLFDRLQRRKANGVMAPQLRIQLER